MLFGELTGKILGFHNNWEYMVTGYTCAKALEM